MTNDYLNRVLARGKGKLWQRKKMLFESNK